MFNLGLRFAEYGITGGFFILLQVILLFIVYPSALPELLTVVQSFYEYLPKNSDAINSTVNSYSDAINSTVNSLVVAIGLLSIFVVGFLLDLIGSLYIVWEVRIFADHIKKNRSWLENTLFKSFADYLESDVPAFLSLAEAIRSKKKNKPKRLSDFSPRRWLDSVKSYYRYYTTLVRLFRRIESVLISYVVVSKSGAGFELVAEQLRMCRLSRSISASFLISYTIQYLIVGVTFRKLPSQPFMTISSLVVLGIILFITYRSYMRFCITLFSVAYTHTKSFDRDDVSSTGVKSDIDDQPAG